MNLAHLLLRMEDEYDLYFLDVDDGFPFTFPKQNEIEREYNPERVYYPIPIISKPRLQKREPLPQPIISPPDSFIDELALKDPLSLAFSESDKETSEFNEDLISDNTDEEEIREAKRKIEEVISDNLKKESDRKEKVLLNRIKMGIEYKDRKHIPEKILEPFMDSLGFDKPYYTNEELADIVNKKFEDILIAPLTPRAIGHLTSFPKYFMKKRQIINGKKYTIYIKKKKVY